MLGPEMPEMGARSAKSLAPRLQRSTLMLENADQVVAKAAKLGAKQQGPVSDMFWGDRCGRLVDPERSLRQWPGGTESIREALAAAGQALGFYSPTNREELLTIATTDVLAISAEMNVVRHEIGEQNGY